MKKSRLLRLGLPLTLLLGLGIWVGAAISGSGIRSAGASGQVSSPCPSATQPAGGDPVPSGSPPATDANTMADWTGVSVPVTTTGQFQWTSSPQQIAGVPNAISISTIVIGGQVAFSAPLTWTPVDAGAGSQPGTSLMELKATATISCVSGSPSVLVVDARAESSRVTPPTSSGS